MLVFMSIPSLKVYSKIKRLYFKYRGLSLQEFKISPFYKVLCSLKYVYPDYDRDVVNYDLEKRYRSLVNRRSRWNKRLKCMKNTFHDLYLITLTFTDEVLSSTSYDTRKKYVLRWCSSYLDDYFGCVDFGKKNGREHYHIIAPIRYAVSPFRVKNGWFCNWEGADSWDYGFVSTRMPSRKCNCNYAFKSSLYAFKSAEDVPCVLSRTVRPFYKKGVKYFDPDLPYNPYTNSNCTLTLFSDSQLF